MLWVYPKPHLNGLRLKLIAYKDLKVETNDKNINNKGNEAELYIIREIAESGDDCPVLMLNLNKYNDEVGLRMDHLKRYINVLEDLLPRVGGRIVWRSASLGRAV